MKKVKWLCLILALLMCLTGCEKINVQGQTTATAPALQLLQMPPYEDEEAASVSTEDEAGNVRVDLWLEGSQLMGGINEDSTSLYPQTGLRYRQGGFHYRFGVSTVGWYEDVLGCFLEAAGDSRVRILRVGNERFPDELLDSYGFSGTEEEMRSFRRDLMTYAVDPMPSIFSGFSSESMEDSFYSLGTPQMNQMTRFMANGGADLENPGRVEDMNALLTAFVDAFHQKKTDPPAQWHAVGNDQDSPLLYALNNLDPMRLSVITCDPAAIRRLQGTRVDGSPVMYVEDILRERKIFDNGLSVGLYAMQMDYMGHMVSFGPADFTDSLIWGKPDYNSNTLRITGILPMPRIMLVLVVGRPEQVESYTASLDARLASNRSLSQMRGPDEGQLTYTANSQTVVQQPFYFEYQYTSVNRPSLGYYTHHTAGAELGTKSGIASREKDGLDMVTLDGQSDEVLIYSWPKEQLPDGVQLDLSTLSGARVEVVDSLLLTEIKENGPQALPEENMQVLTLRDKLYCFERVENPFEGREKENPFTLETIAWSGDGERLEVRVKVNRSLLNSGYYRLKLVADVTGEQLEWPAVDWAQNDAGLSVEISNTDVIAWETLMQTLTRYGRSRNSIPGNFKHAWGSYTGKDYQGVEVPDFPQVYKAPNLERLLSQIRSAANLETAPLIRCTFDVFVSEILLP